MGWFQYQDTIITNPDLEIFLKMYYLYIWVSVIDKMASL